MRSSHWMLRGAVLICVAACLGSGCGGSGDEPYTHPLLIPANAFGGDAPDSARYVDPATFGALLDQGRLELFTRLDVDEELVEQEAMLDEQRGIAEALYADRMDVLTRHTVAPHDMDPDFEASPDGNWSFSVNPDQKVELSGLLYAYQDLVESTQRFRTKENQLGIYEEFYGRLDPDFVLERSLPDPADVASYTYEKILNLNRMIADDWPAYYPPLTSKKPPGYPSSVEDEEGYGGGIDGAAYPIRTGIAHQKDFPLKWYVTSIKDQGRRGSCTAFGVTAAVEAMVARDRGRWVNLSEQMLFNRAKQKWEGSNYGDSYSTSKLIFEMTLKTYAYSFERSWDYNRSPLRVKFDYAGLYMNSCLAVDDNDVVYSYGGEHCSDSNHQASMLVTGAGPFNWVAFLNPEVDVPPDAGFRVLIGRSVSDPGVIGPAFAIGMLALNVPVIISVTVPATSMKGKIVEANQDIVPYYSFEPGGTGGHCMLLVGFIPNALLPVGVPLSPGAGYFICKNSWGTGYGDGGYIYLSDLWVMRWARGLYTLAAVY